MTLYEIDKAIENTILDAVDTETGELTGDLSILDELRIARETKLENIGLYIKNLSSEAESIKDEERSLQIRRKVKENKIERLKKYLSEALDGDKFETARIALSFRKSTQVYIEDADKLPKKYQKISIDADKTAIKAALQAGVKVRGAELVQKQNLQIK